MSLKVSVMLWQLSCTHWPTCLQNQAVRGLLRCAALGCFPDLHDILRKDHLFRPHQGGVARGGQVAREHPDTIQRIAHHLGDRPIGQADSCSRLQQPEVDHLAHGTPPWAQPLVLWPFRCLARAGERQVASSSQLAASMNSAQRRYKFRRLCSLDFASVISITTPGRCRPSQAKSCTSYPTPCS